ncbi:SDR family NAD(P)-dependent oxidoreductase [Labrys sp. La1]|uniref:SDR family NAD(P)-dependent oxidoreductase n=1 Tax=Labrys sp. La1 TaxID=3404917 RepID=UPI003EBE0DE2
MARLAGKVAIITGATGGIGEAAAHLFAEEGAKVAVTGRSRGKGEAVAAGINARGGTARYLEMDVTLPDSVGACFRTVAETWGRLDVLYNNAGGSSSADGPVTTTPVEEFWRCIKLDLFGTWLCCRHAIPLMQECGGGSIVNCSSIVGAMGIPNRDAYTAAKGGVISLTRSMAVEFAKDRIRVNVLVPGAVATDRVLGFFEREPHLKAQWDAYLLGIAEPIDVARAALYLACDDSRRMTGHQLPIDGGILIS